ncbi:MAG: hypothetical protein KDB68_16660 [Planctomycetes bacterium]|nr:hypothetical protein [Planctomycetota bacterium]MCA8945458.1 hypothetical protein [Planctomycetota bacterium]
MSTYRIRNLNAGTPDSQRQRLKEKLLQIPSIQKVAILAHRREVRLTVIGMEPNPKMVKAVCDELGFMLEKRVTKRL